MRAADGGVHDRDHVAQLGFEGRVEVCAALDRSEVVRVCELGEDADVAAVLELGYLMTGREDERAHDCALLVCEFSAPEEGPVCPHAPKLALSRSLAPS